MNQSSAAEEKGRYCRFVQTADGNYRLEPVKVPAHVKAAREERIHRREVQSHARQNRERAQAINGHSVAFLALALGFFAVVCCTYLAMQSQAYSHSDHIASLQAQVSELAEENDTVEKRLSVSENLLEIEEAAEQELGMQYVDESQIEYYTMDDSTDYMIQYGDVE
ncbi:MAG: hypothetical protein LUF32_07615 [Clostridiales bacterium]|nr:hypothetical protein [Clostridiales bacterium]